MTLPKESRIAVIIPGMDRLNNISEVSQRVAPNEYAESDNSSGALLITSSIARASMGMINSVTVSMPASREVFNPKKTMIVNPKAPYTMEGIPNNTSNISRIRLASQEFFFAYTLTYSTIGKLNSNPNTVEPMVI